MILQRQYHVSLRPRGWSSLFSVASFCIATGCASTTEPPVGLAEYVLTPTSPTAEGTRSLRAAGNGSFICDIVRLDTRAFQAGGRVTVQLSLGNGASAASFSLFPEAATLTPPAPRPDHLDWARDVPPGWDGSIGTVFEARAGQVYQLCAEGNWFSPLGATNTYKFRVSVR